MSSKIVCLEKNSLTAYLWAPLDREERVYFKVLMCVYTLWRLLNRIKAKTKSGRLLTKSCVQALDPSLPTTPFFEIAPYSQTFFIKKKIRKDSLKPSKSPFWHAFCTSLLVNGSNLQLQGGIIRIMIILCWKNQTFYQIVKKVLERSQQPFIKLTFYTS